MTMEVGKLKQSNNNNGYTGSKWMEKFLLNQNKISEKVEGM
jgi:hypothetical protein